MKNQILYRFVIILGFAVIAGLFTIPPQYLGDNQVSNKLQEKDVTLGLDLAGGTELDYRIDLSDAKAQNSDDDSTNDVNIDQIAESVRDALEARVNPAGVGEIIVKRSQVNGEEHVLIQMPPSSNVDQAKNNAEKDNRLEFFEEDPDMLIAIRLRIAGYIAKTDPANWDTKKQEILEKNEHAELVTIDHRYQDEITDQALAEKIIEAGAGTILEGVQNTRTEMDYTVGEDGQIQINSYPKEVMAMVYVKDKTMTERDKSVQEKAEARHILFGYPGAERAAEDIKYQTKEAAQAEAQKVLEQLKTEGTENFEDLAKEYSTEGAAQNSGGNLGSFGRGQMIPAFEEAVFNAIENKEALAEEEVSVTEEESGSDISVDFGGDTDPSDFGLPKLIPELVETDFGFHIIEVLDYEPAKEKKVTEPQVSYEMIVWDKEALRWTPTNLGGKQLETATVGFDQTGQPMVNLLFDSEGADLFAELTGRVAGRTKGQACEGNGLEDGSCRLGIKVGGDWITQPRVSEKIMGRQSQISGNFTFESARALADGLNLGAIDAPVKLAGQLTIQPELGQDQLMKSLRAGIIGLLVTMVFMILMYRMAGFVAAFSLMLYAALFVTILKIWPASFGGPIVLTLPGIAGIALSIGLAVDGNILIFERLKEELRNGKSLKKAIDLGFERAWPAIRDSNITTFITCVILFFIGSSIVRGFAITLILGTLLSMFTALTVSRNLLRVLLLIPFFQSPWFYGLSQKSIQKETEKNSDKVRKRKKK